MTHKNILLVMIITYTQTVYRKLFHYVPGKGSEGRIVCLNFHETLLFILNGVAH